MSYSSIAFVCASQFSIEETAAINGENRNGKPTISLLFLVEMKNLFQFLPLTSVSMIFFVFYFHPNDSATSRLPCTPTNIVWGTEDQHWIISLIVPCVFRWERACLPASAYAGCGCWLLRMHAASPISLISIAACNVYLIIKDSESGNAHTNTHQHEATSSPVLLPGHHCTLSSSLWRNPFSQWYLRVSCNIFYFPVSLRAHFVFLLLLFTARITWIAAINKDGRRMLSACARIYMFSKQKCRHTTDANWYE